MSECPASFLSHAHHMILRDHIGKEECKYPLFQNQRLKSWFLCSVESHGPSYVIPWPESLLYLDPQNIQFTKYVWIVFHAPDDGKQQMNNPQFLTSRSLQHKMILIRALTSDKMWNTGEKMGHSTRQVQVNNVMLCPEG